MAGTTGLEPATSAVTVSGVISIFNDLEEHRTALQVIGSTRWTTLLCIAMCIPIALQLFHSKESLRAIPDEFQWLARACNDPNLLTVPFSVEASHKPSWSGCAIRDYCFRMARDPGTIAGGASTRSERRLVLRVPYISGSG